MKVPLMTGNPGTNYLDSKAIKGFRRDIKRRKIIVIFLGLSPLCGTRRLQKIDLNLGKRIEAFMSSCGCALS